LRLAVIFTALIPLALSSALAVPGAIAPAGAAPPARAQPAPKPRWETLPLPPEMPKAAASGRVSAAGGAEIYYATFGKAGAPPVILLHGGLGNGDHYAHQVPALAERFHVIAIDSRGQGRSTLGKGKLSYATMASDVALVMTELKLEKASVAGWSDGGAVALALAIAHPARVDRLFVFATNYDAKGSKPRGGNAPTFAQYSARCRADMARLAKKGAYEAATAALAPVWSDPASFTKDQLRSIKARALIGDGDHDEIIELAQIREMATLLPNARPVVLEGTSHFALWQDPTAFTKALVDFLTAP
jgi:pimeloyl-ACP methyl ester carboxylesterase